VARGKNTVIGNRRGGGRMVFNPKVCEGAEKRRSYSES